MKRSVLRRMEDGSHHRVALAGLLILALVGSIIMFGVPRQNARANGLTFVVDRTDDDPTASTCSAAANDCSLRGAILAANSDAFADTITLPAGTYTLTEPGTLENGGLTGDLDIQGNLTINGAGQSTTIIDGNGSVIGEQAFQVFGGYDVDFNDLKITGGDSGGSAIVNFATLTLTNVTMTGNQSSSSGGAVSTSGWLILESTTMSNNTADNGGGAIYMASGNVDVNDSTLGGNTATGTTSGGAIFQINGTLTFNRSEVSGNEAYSGGGISSSGGTILMAETTLSGNTANTGQGGALYKAGTGSFTISESSITGNTAAGGGGGISLATSGTSGDIHESLISGNISNDTSDGGGGIRAAMQGLQISNSTISGNTAKNNGGGLFTYVGNVNVELENVTMTDNVADSDSLNGGSGSGIYSNAGDVAFTNSILAGNAGDQCDALGGTLTSSDFNLASDGTCNLIGGNDLPNTDPLLGPLQDNGGLTLTHALLPGSPAIDSANTGGGNCPATDQRIVVRPIGAACDIGAFEAPLWVFLPLIQR